MYPLISSSCKLVTLSKVIPLKDDYIDKEKAEAILNGKVALYFCGIKEWPERFLHHAIVVKTGLNGPNAIDGVCPNTVINNARIVDFLVDGACLVGPINKFIGITPGE